MEDNNQITPPTISEAEHRSKLEYIDRLERTTTVLHKTIQSRDEDIAKLENDIKRLKAERICTRIFFIVFCILALLA